MGAFVISKRFNDTYKFVFTSRKGKVIFTSLSYELKFEGEEDIVRIKEGVDRGSFVEKKSSKGMYWFQFWMGEQLVATSRKYSTELRLKKGIEEVRVSVATAEILDFSEDTFVFPD